MEHTVVFEQKAMLIPKDMNRIGKETIDSIILNNIRKNLEGKCNQHGFIVPNSLEILSRNIGQIDHGHYTGNIVFHVQVQAKVYNPVNGTMLTGNVEKKNKMGLYIIYKDAIRILIPRDLHIGNTRFEEIEPGEEITVEIKKSRFQIQDSFILSIGVLPSGDSAEAPRTETLLGPVGVSTEA
jgi:DNA-directed RNA polymerase subunit E'/Rpb7